MLRLDTNQSSAIILLCSENVVKDYIPAIAAIIVGIFAVISALIAWKLKSSSDYKDQITALNKEKRDEIKQLYTDTFCLFEQAIRQVLNKEKFTLGQAFSENNARVHLLAPEKIVNQYSKVASLLENWSGLHFKASPRQIQIGEQTVTVLQAPDPTEKYKEPANAEYQKFQEELKIFVELMREELGEKE